VSADGKGAIAEKPVKSMAAAMSDET